MTLVEHRAEAVAEAESGQVRDPGDGAFRTGHVATVAASHLVHDTYTAFLAPLLPAFIAAFSLSNAQAGLLSVLLRVPSLSQPFIGLVANRFDLRYPVVIAPVVTAAMMSLLGVAPSYTALAVLLSVVGCSSAVFHATGPVVAGSLSGRNLGRGMGFWMVGGELGRTLGPIVIVSAVKFLTMRRIPWLALGGLVSSVLLASLLRSVPSHSSSIGQRGSWRSALRVLRPILTPLIAILVARSLMLATFTTYLPTFLSEEGADLWFAGVSLSVLEASGVVGALLVLYLESDVGAHVGRQMAGYTIASILLIIMFLFMSKQFVEGLTSGALKW